MNHFEVRAPRWGPFLRVLFPIVLLLTSGATAGSAWRAVGPDGAGPTRNLVIDPQNPSTLYLAGGNGVYKSVDGGDHWSSTSRGLGGQMVFSLVIDPLTPSTLYAATSRRIYKTTDGAARWFPAECGLGNELKREIDIDRQNPGTLYAATSDGVYKTTDGGRNWFASSGGLASLDVQALRVAPSNPALVYAATLGGGVFQSSDRGATWWPANGELTDPRVLLLAVDPVNPQVVFAGAFAGLFRTTNGGGAWQSADNGLDGTLLSLAFDPRNPGVVYAGTTSNGIFKTVDGGGAWSPANQGVIDGGLADFGISSLAVHPDTPSLVFAATRDGGPGVLRTRNSGGDWAPAGLGLTLHRVLNIVLNPVNPNILYVSVNNRNGIYKSLDAGATWRRMVNGFRDDLGRFTNLPSSLAMDPSDPEVLYLGSNGDGLFRTRNGAGVWERLGHALLNNRFVTAVAVDPGNGRVLYAATSPGGVIKSIDEGATWTRTGAQITAIVTDIDVDPSQSSRVYAVTSQAGGAFRSQNGGASWTPIANGLEAASPFQLAIDPDDSSVLYVATREAGVFRSDDRGNSWRAVNRGLEGFSLQSLAAAPGVLYAGTRTHGVHRSLDRGETWALAAVGLQNRLISALAVQSDNPENVYAGLNLNSVFRRVGRPSYLYAAGPIDQSPQFDGLAFSNYSLVDADVRLAQIEFGPPPVDGYPPPLFPPVGSLTTRLSLAAGRQSAQTRDQLFAGSSTRSAWIVQLSDSSSLASFFQFGSADLSQLDGGTAITEPLTRFLFTRVFEGATAFRGQNASTRLSVFNPQNSTVTLRLTYFPAPANPAPPIRLITREIPVGSYLQGTFSELFETGASGGYILGEVTSGGGVVGFQLIQLPDRRTIVGLNAASTVGPGRSYSAQLASQDGLFTNLNLINSSPANRRVVLGAIAADGSPIGARQVRMMAPGAQISVDAGTLFGEGAEFVGSLEVNADGDGVVGDVIFGDATDFRFAAALPLQSEAFTDAVFSQVANVPGFFTGLALFYPGSPFGAACGEDAEVTIEVFRADGTTSGSAVVALEAGHRISRLVPELAPASAGQAGGYIRVRSTQPLIAQMLFGALDNQGIRLLSAVPPAVAR